MTAKEIVLNYFAQIALIRENKEHELDKYAAADICWHLPRSTEGDNAFKGIDGILKMIREVLPLYYKPDSLEFVPHSFIGEGDLVHFHVTLKATTANNKAYENDYQILVKVEGDLVKEAWEYFDTLHLNQILNS